MRDRGIGPTWPPPKKPIRALVILDFAGQIPDGVTAIHRDAFRRLQGQPIHHDGQHVGTILTEPVPIAPMRAQAYVELHLTPEDAAHAFPWGFVLDPLP